MTDSGRLPFTNIALTLSGGGSRAVGFHLGTLDVLNELGLLESISTLSTVSGGTLVGSSYALAIKEGKSFDQFFTILYDFLPSFNTVDALLETLTDTNHLAFPENANITTSLAQLYHYQYFSQYFENTHFGALWEESPKIHLKEITFNATDFTSANGFRFQKSEYNCRIGNGKVWINEEQAKMLRMADIMTASSCVPGGMEPYTFPVDFYWPNDNFNTNPAYRPDCDAVTDYLNLHSPYESISLMDGGVYDNQGISAALLAIDRTSKNDPEREPIDLFIISDTPIIQESYYSQEQKINDTFFNRITLQQLHMGLWMIAILLACSTADNLFGLFSANTHNYAEPAINNAYILFSMIIPLLLTSGLTCLLLWSHWKLKTLGQKIESNTPGLSNSLWFYIKKINIGNIVEMVSTRASSVAAMINDIFWVRVRQLEYKAIYKRPSLNNSIIANEIYTLCNFKPDPDINIGPSKLQLDIAKLASNMPTKLWLDNSTKGVGGRGDLDNLIACGQSSICLNIIKICQRKLANNDKDQSIQALHSKALSIWKTLNNNPYQLIDSKNNYR